MILTAFINQHPAYRRQLMDFCQSRKYAVMLRPFSGSRPFVIQKKVDNLIYRININYYNNNSVRIVPYIEVYSINLENSIVFRDLISMATHAQILSDVFSNYFTDLLIQESLIVKHTEMYEKIPKILGFDGDDRFVRSFEHVGFSGNPGVYTYNFKSILEFIQEQQPSQDGVHKFRCNAFICQAEYISIDTANLITVNSVVCSFKELVFPCLVQAFQGCGLKVSSHYSKDSAIVKIKLAITNIGEYILEFDALNENKVNVAVVDDTFVGMVAQKNKIKVLECLAQADIEVDLP